MLLLLSAVLGFSGSEDQLGGPNELNFFPPIPLGETWIYDLNTNTWMNVEPSTKPSARYDHAMAYDSESDRVILFGGQDYTPSDETWTYDFNANAWTEVTSAVGPRGRHSHAMAYDSESDRVILFGGTLRDEYSNETWAYDFNTNNWTFMEPATSPSGLSDAMAYDAESDRIILFSDGETWAYDFNTNNWTNANPGPGRSPFVGDSMTYDAESDRVVLIDGGSGGTTPGLYPEETRTRSYDFNTNTWTNVVPGTGPSAPSGDPAMTYDAGSDQVILFDSRGQTWTYDFNTNTWRNMDPAAGPFARFAHAMAYDAESDRVILFGGAESTEFRPEPWRLALAVALVIAGLATVLFLLIQGMRGGTKGKEEQDKGLPTRNSGWIAIASLAVAVVFQYLIPLGLVGYVALVVYAFSSWKVMSKGRWIVALAILILIFLVLPVLVPELVLWWLYY